MSLKEGFVYLWFDRKHKRFCIGSHVGTLDDGYVTSTGYMTRAYKKRPEDFKRRILQYHYGDHKALLEAEQYWLNKIYIHELFSQENVSNGTCRYYNIKNVASGLSGEIASILKLKFWNSEAGKKEKAIRSLLFSENNPCKKGNIPWNKGMNECPTISIGRLNGKMQTPEENSARMKKLWTEGRYDNKKHPETISEEHKRKIGQAQIGNKKTDESKEKISMALKGKLKTEETKEKMRLAAIKTSSKIVICTCCGFVGNGPAMKRWHFTNCRN